MTSSSVARSFLSHIGFPPADASELMNKLNNDMSRLMLCSNKDAIAYGLGLDLRLRLLRAIRCFHKEKWSKSLMNHFHGEQARSHAFESLVYHLVKCHIWLVYASWTLRYLAKNLFAADESDLPALRALADRVHRLCIAIGRLKQMMPLIRERLRTAEKTDDRRRHC